MMLAVAQRPSTRPDIMTRMSDTGRNNDTNYLPRVARGESNAVRECIDRYAGLVWSLARRFSTTAADAEDAVQEIFLELWKSAGRFDPNVASETTFVAMIARRRLIDRRRKEGRTPDTQALSGATDIETSSSNVDAPATQSEDVAMAKRALAKLSLDQQKVLQLSIFHGLSHDRISTATGFPLGTVKTHARRGLMRIRDLIEAEKANASSSEVTP